MDDDSYGDHDRRRHYQTSFKGQNGYDEQPQDDSDDPYYQEEEEDQPVQGGGLADYEDDGYNQGYEDEDDGYGAYGSGYMPPQKQKQQPQGHSNSSYRHQEHQGRRSQGPVDMDDYVEEEERGYSHQQQRQRAPPQQERAMQKSLADQAANKRRQQQQQMHGTSSRSHQQQKHHYDDEDEDLYDHRHQQQQRPSGNHRRASADRRRESAPSDVAKAIHYGQDRGDEQGWGHGSSINHMNLQMEEDSEIDHDEFYDAQEWEAPDPLEFDDQSRESGSNHSRPSSNASSGRRSSGTPARRFSNFMHSKRRMSNQDEAERPSLFGALTSSVSMATSVVTSTVSMTANVATSTVGAIGQVGNSIGQAGTAIVGGGANTSERRASNQGQKTASTMQSFFDRRKPKNPPTNTKIASRELEIIRRCQENFENREQIEEERRLKAMAEDEENIRLREMEAAERLAVTQEVLAYREMMKDMGQEEKLAPEDMKKAAEEYDDRLAMADTLAGM